MSPPLQTSVITIVRGRAEHLRRQRIALQGRAIRRHVVVGMGEAPDVSGVPEVPTAVVSMPDDGGPLPLAAARNLGAATAVQDGAELLVFLDVDCIPGEQLITRYRDAAVSHPGPALLCGPVSYLDPPPPSGYPGRGLDRWGRPHPGRPDPADGTVVPDDRWQLFWSLSFAVRAEHWSTIGGFCEAYRGYGAEDTDFALMAEEAGAQLCWVGGAHAFHQFHPPSRYDEERIGELVANCRVFRDRHGSWPMRGWLDELADRGQVEFDPARGFLVATPSGRAPGG